VRAWRRGAWVVILLVLSGTSGAEEHAAVAPGPQFKDSGWHKLWFGEGYRKLWATPARVPVLYLGDLTPAQQVGQLQTAGLAFEGTDGRRYWFRSLHKEPDRALPPEWRQGWTSQLIRDRTASTHPAAAVIRASLAAAGGIPVPPVRLVVMPDDPRLGPYRTTFAGQMGTVEEFPRPSEPGKPGYMGADQIVSSQTLWTMRLADPGVEVDARAFLRARILDLFIGDYDRNHEQWRWAHVPGQAAFRPLPEDPDMAFARQDGFVMAQLRGHEPRFQVFSDRYPKAAEAEMGQADVDRWVLSALDRQAFRAEAESLKAAFTDAVIEEAVRSMPAEWYALNGEALTSALEARRNELVKDIDRMYLFLSRVVEVQATDASEIVTLRRVDGGVDMAVALAARPEAPYFHRTFDPRETEELRVYLHGGDDRLTNEVRGGEIRLRVMTGAGRDLVDDARGGGAEVWTGDGAAQIERGPGTHEKSQPWVNPSPVEGAPWREPRNTGSWRQFGPKGFWAPDLGAVVGVDATWKSWGFRQEPFAREHFFQAIYAAGRKNGRADYLGTFIRPASAFSSTLHVYGSGIDRINFFGFGNDTAKTEPEQHEVEQKNIAVEPTLYYRPSRRAMLFGGVDMRYSDSQESASSILGQTLPYGTGSFGSVGLRLGLELDSRGKPGPYNIWDMGTATSAREVAGQKASGVRLLADGVYRPAVWDVRSGYGQVSGALSGYAGSSRVVLAGRVGGQRVFGEYPWFDAAFLGGHNDRGFPFQRFAGNTALYGGAELRFWAARIRVLPLRLGLFGFYETGRVWLDGTSDGEWHGSYGGGLLMQLPSTPIMVRARVARSNESTLFYFGSGFTF
jgi:hypothetical protein